MSTGDQTDVASRAYAYADGQDHRDFPGVQTRVVAGWIAGYRAAELDQTARVDVRQAATELDRTNAADALRVASGNLYDFLDSEGVGDLLNQASAAALRRRADAVQDAIRATTSAFVELPEPTDVRPDGMAVWAEPRWIVMQEADGTKWVHVHVFDQRGPLYGHSHTFSAELATVIGAAAVRPIAPNTDYEVPF